MIGLPDIAALLPHRGPMCLLEEIASHDERRIVCRASSHRAPGNPLRAGDRLPALAAIEYAAQALAVHCALLDGAAAGKPRRGLLAGAREVLLHVERLDDLPGPLEVRAERLVASGPRLLYAFALAAGGRALASGRVAVVLRDGTLA